MSTILERLTRKVKKAKQLNSLNTPLHYIYSNQNLHKNNSTDFVKIYTQLTAENSYP